MWMNDDLNRTPPKHPKQKLRFSTDVATSVNHMYIFGKGHKTLTTAAKQYIQKTQRQCLEAMKQQKWKKEDETVWFYMDLYFYFPDKRIRDSHNCIKLLMDALQGILFVNDYYIMPRVQDVRLDRDNPRIEIVFFPRTP
jgi:crossover junction endodeoxyribonuclease RusA